MLHKLVDAYDIAFDPGPLEDCRISVHRAHGIDRVPYLVHTNYELLLLLDGRKKLARMGDSFPPMQFPGEQRFDHWVARGLLHRKEVIDRWDKPIKNWLGHRTVYYALKGEEWRIPAMQLIWDIFGKSGGWNAHFERLEGTLFGYEDWQNDWWISRRLAAGGFGGLPMCCAVTAAGLAWVESAGFRALPPCDATTLDIIPYDDDDEAAPRLRDFLLKQPAGAVLLRFMVNLRSAEEILPLPMTGDRWTIKSDQIPALNRHLRGKVSVALGVAA